MFDWLDKISIGTLMIPALFLGLAPFVPEPHLWEKLQMLINGSLSRPIDIFDLFLHGAPLILLGIKVVRVQRQSGAGNAD